MDLKIESLIKLGGKLWENGDMKRVYFNNLPERYGLKCEYYSTGNVNHAWVDGESISNSRARRILSSLTGKFWYDLSDGKFKGKGVSQDATEALAVIIRQQAAEMAELAELDSVLN